MADKYSILDKLVTDAIESSGVVPAIRAHEAEIIRAAAARAGRAVLDARYGQQLAEMVTNAVLATPRGMAGNADSRPLAAFADSGEQSMPEAEKAGLL